jgi:hypothetical protein
MSIAHELRAHRRCVAEERNSFAKGSAILGCSVLAVVGAVGLFIAYRPEPGPVVQVARQSVHEHVRRTAGGVSVQAMDADDRDVAMMKMICKRNLAVAGLLSGGARKPSGSSIEDARHDDIRRGMMDGSMCEQSMEAFKSSRDMTRDLKGR